MKRLKYAIYILIIIGISLYLTYPLLRGVYIYPLGEYEIYKSFLTNFIDILKQGKLPVWNEYIGNGHPAMYFGHYPIAQNTILYMLFGANDFIYYFARFLSLFILLASFVYAGKILKFGYLISLGGALIYFSINFVPRLFLYETIGNLLIYPLLIALILQVIIDKRWENIIIFNVVYIFWLSGGLITYVYIQLIMLSVIYWIAVFVITFVPCRLSNLKKNFILYFVLFIIPISAVLYQYYFIYDVIIVSNRLKEGLIISPFNSIVWKELWLSFQSSSYFWIGVILIPLSFVRRSINISKIIPMLLIGLLCYLIMTKRQFISTSIIFTDYIIFLNSTVFRTALLTYLILSFYLSNRYSHSAIKVYTSDVIIFAIYISLLSYYFYSPGNIAEMDYMLFKELSIYSRIIFILCLLFSIRSYKRNKIAKIIIFTLIILYLIRSHLTIPLMRFAGIVWYPTRDGVTFSALFAFLFLFGLENIINALKNTTFRNMDFKVFQLIKCILFLSLIVLLAHDSFNKFYYGQSNKVVFPSRMDLARTPREIALIKSREEIPVLNKQLLDLDKTTKHFYRIFTPDATFDYLAGNLQNHKIYEAGIYESSISKDYKNFFEYTILRKPSPDIKDIRNVLPHAVFTKHVHAGLGALNIEIPYNDVYLFFPGDAQYLSNQNIEFFWDLMQVKYLVVGSILSNALEKFSDKESYKLLSYYPNLDLNLYEITKDKKYSRFAVLPLDNEEDFHNVIKKINSNDVDILKQIYARIIYIEPDNKDFILLESQKSSDRRCYEIDAKRKAILIEFESWNRHWNLRINEESGKLYKAFGIFRGIKIEPGKNTIEINYQVPYFKELFWLSILVILIYGYLSIRYIPKTQWFKQSMG